MNLVELAQYTTIDEKMGEYLRKLGVLKIYRGCPYYQGTRINRVRRFKLVIGQDPPLTFSQEWDMDHMDFREIGKLVSEDRFSLEYLWKKLGNTDCPSCSSSEFYYHQRWRVRCKGCKKDYWPLQGTRFALLRISPSRWLPLVKLFEALHVSQDGLPRGPPEL